MSEQDPVETSRYSPLVAAAELRADGLDDAEEIGHGGFGVVYRCAQPGLDRVVAVKVLTVVLDQENRARFFREQQAMGRLTGHPNIVDVLQVGETDSGWPFIVMPYYRQASLDARIRDRGPLPLREVLRVGVKLAGAVETAHRLGILHRDVKPGNILLTDYGEPVLTDFGIAHIAGGFETATGTVTGSPAYTAPEVLTGHPPTPTSDIYSLGATMFSALTGHAAFERLSGEQVVAQFLRITSQPLPDLREKGIPDDISAVISRAMSRNPDERPGTAAELGEQLRQIQSNRGFVVDEMALLVGPVAQQIDSQSKAEEGLPLVSTPRGKEGNLPAELSSFIGRRHELTHAKDLLSGSRLLTLTGIGGVGKTRLALHVAANLSRHYASGVWLVELGELRDPALPADAVAAALGLRDQAVTPMVTVLINYLATRKTLLILDNCEQVIGAVAELSETLLQSCPDLRILATSREALTVGGEVVLRVPALTVPDRAHKVTPKGLPRYDAVRLFTERATAAVPGFALTDENAGAVAEICRRLDGLPLPIELAAARLRAMSPQQILQRLTDRYTLLTQGSRNAPSRQQTLRLSIDWSFELCTGREQLVWGRVAVFAGSFELDAAEQVCGEDLESTDLLDALTSLVDKSILIREESGTGVRFRLLETVRDYGREKLDQTGEYPLLQRRHRDWYVQMMLKAEAEWISPHQLLWISRLNRDQSNIREALELCVSDDPTAGLQLAAAQFWYWISQGLYSEGRRWLDRLLSRTCSPAPTVERAKALNAASLLAFNQGDLQSGTALVDECRALAQSTDDPMIGALALYSEAALFLFSGEPSRACPLLKNAITVFGAQDNRTLETGALSALGMAYELSGETNLAIEQHEQVLAITERHGEVMQRSYTLWALGLAWWRHGATDRGAPLLEHALRLTRQANIPRLAAACLEVMAWIAGERRDWPRATILLGAAEQIGRSVESVARAYPNLDVYHEKCGQGARSFLGQKPYESAVRHGRRMDFDTAVAYALGEQKPSARSPENRPEPTLTKREQQVANLISKGLTNKAIAAKLVISDRTAQGHVEHILAKLGFTSRAQVAAWVADQTH
ncbi:protein kinase [Rhodococcus sp. T2V]|uniref:protein kinase domain-containing protein n=1 Tax=Rhodococcus sp. T2V TaxID=3034164 RepID=UPI0023E1B84D|nr:protein kinase [Rhodococcus sp. T2V]MDF3313166.1 protein kinase [Rhodococcus sp. T2V]